MTRCINCLKRLNKHAAYEKPDIIKCSCGVMYSKEIVENHKAMWWWYVSIFRKFKTRKHGNNKVIEICTYDLPVFLRNTFKQRRMSD